MENARPGLLRSYSRTLMTKLPAIQFAGAAVTGGMSAASWCAERLSLRITDRTTYPVVEWGTVVLTNVS